MALAGMVVGKKSSSIKKSPSPKKAWENQISNARAKRLDGNKWKYSTNISGQKKRKVLPRVRSPTSKRMKSKHNSQILKLIATKSSIENTRSDEPRVAMVVSDHELNQMVVMQKVKSRPIADDKKLYEDDFYMWQANNPTTFRLHPITIDYEQDGDRLEHAEFYINDSVNMSITFLE